jgi:LemA protein
MALAIAALATLAVLVTAWLGLAWRGLTGARNRAEETWAAIEGRLVERHRLVPALEAAVRAVVSGEDAVLDRLDAARAAALTARGAFERADAERRLVAALAAAAALTERHPLLGGAAPFVDVQARLAEVEDALQHARRVYNADVRLYLRRRRHAPASWLTRLGDFPERPYYELDHTRGRRAALRLAAE